MATNFPEIEPASRSFTAPKWQTTSQTSQSGVTTRRLWGSRPSGATLTLQFRNVNDTSTSAILDAYNAAKGSVDSLLLPQIIFNGADQVLQSWFDGSATGAGLLWHFTEGTPPQVESVAPGRSNVNVSLTAELILG
jgi:hypothetical protein